MPDYYQYEDVNGQPIYRVVKKVSVDGKKKFYQQRRNGRGWIAGLADTKSVPYHLPLILRCIDSGSSEIWVVEGEKDADNAIEAFSVAATTNSGGAGKWTDEHSKYLLGAEVVYICYDDDEKGHEHAWQVHDSLKRIGVQDVRFRRPCIGKDVTDHINAGYSRYDLLKRKPPIQKAKNKPEKPEYEENHLPAAFQLAIDRLRELGPVTIEGDPEDHQYNALCPAHDDSDPSLSVQLAGSETDSVQIKVTCHKGCGMEEIAEALGMNPMAFTHKTIDENELDRAVAQELLRQRARIEAKRTLAEEALNTQPTDWTEWRSGTDELKIPLEPVQYLIEDWFAYGTFTLMVADPKAGKTRLAMNLMQALTENKPFLDKFSTSMAEGSRVLYLNYDMPENLFRTYLKDYSWQNPDRFIVQHLLAGQFPFWDKTHFDKFSEFALKENVQTLIIDTFAVASQGFVTDENSNTEVSAFCAEVRKLKEAASIPNVLMLHHRGRSKDEHSRGASAFDAAVDALWFLRMSDREDHAAPRSLRAIGRSVGKSPIELDYDLATERYTTTGAAHLSREDTKARVVKLGKFANYCKALKVYYDENGRWPRGKVARGFLVGENLVRNQLMTEAVAEGLVEHVSMVGRSYEVRLLELGLSTVNSAAASSAASDR